MSEMLVPPKMYIRKYSPRMIRLCRESRGLTQAELARKSGVSQTEISNLENGVYLKADPSVLAELAQRLEYPVSIFERENEEVDDSGTTFICGSSRLGKRFCMRIDGEAQ